VNLTYRFHEVVTAVELLPEFDGLTSDNLRLPNGTDGFDDYSLSQALLAQALRESDEWRNKFYLCLMNTAMSAVLERSRAEEETPIKEQDLIAFALAANVAWISGAGEGIFKAFGALSASSAASGLDIPALAYAIMQQPSPDTFGDMTTIDPLSFFEEN